MDDGWIDRYHRLCQRLHRDSSLVESAILKSCIPTLRNRPPAFNTQIHNISYNVYILNIQHVRTICYTHFSAKQNFGQLPHIRASNILEKNLH